MLLRPATETQDGMMTLGTGGPDNMEEPMQCLQGASVCQNTTFSKVILVQEDQPGCQYARKNIEEQNCIAGNELITQSPKHSLLGPGDKTVQFTVLLDLNARRSTCGIPPPVLKGFRDL